MGLLDFLFGRGGKDDFAKKVMAVLKARGFEHPVRYDPETFALDLGERGTMNLHNVYKEWGGIPAADRAASLRGLVDFAFEPEEHPPFDEAAAQLLPLVRSRMFFSAQMLRDGTYQGGYRLLNGFLALAIGFDRPNNIVLLRQETFDDWGMTFDGIMDRALDNLRAISPARFERQPQGFYLSEWGDYHDASRMMLPELFLNLNLKGAPVAIVFSRSCIAVAGSDDLDALNAMAAFVDGAMSDEARPVAYAAAILENGEWLAYEPKDRARAPIAEMAIKQRLWDYDEQGPILEEWLEKRGEDRFVAPLEGVRTEDRLATWTSWAEDARPLLPRADMVWLAGADGRTMLRRWDDIETVTGPFALDRDFFPPRYDGRRWLDEDQWRRLESGFEEPEGPPEA